MAGLALLLMAAGAATPTGEAAAQQAEGIGYDRGSPDAPITVIEFGDFGCTSCGRFARETLPLLLKDYVEPGKVRWKYIPFVAGFPNGREATRAAECAAEAGKFWPMHDRLYADQAAWIGERSPEKLFWKYATELGLDLAKFQACYREDRGKERTRRNNRLASELRVRATPTFFVGDLRVQGAFPIDAFRTLLASQQIP